ncbi:hypothetical protein C8250_019895 [Streptomyces sp. So13.3]|uniref:FG-GAP and VCBS repeat-containing protein n=1 Tax=Streptomyces sp. So13.3 TaxID=2136173 RepID=UPI00164E330E|nr:FG-GAP and VCBS repeat-containing protein [Streptomyces sp. So13.3]QNA73881.1 hypothetical protein C8250_019895 [Streptomyces sp. So13.3]
MRHRISPIAAAVLLAGIAGCSGTDAPTPVHTPPAAKAAGGPRADFNGDGYNDLAVRVNGLRVELETKPGAIVVTYGGKDGLDAARRTVIDQDTDGIPDGHLDGVMTYGDLDNDGYTDLVFSDVVVWGGADGLSGGTAFDLPGQPSDSSGGAGALAVGDFNGDGKAELAAFIGTKKNPRISVLAGGFTRKGPRSGTYDLAFSSVFANAGGLGPLETHLTAGDLTGDHISDLIVGTRWYTDNDKPPGNTFFQGSRQGLADVEGKDVAAGHVTAIGDIDLDGYGDLAIGDSSSHQFDGQESRAGFVTVTYGSKDGPGDGRPDQVISKDTPGLPGPPPRGPFADSVALGDVNGDGFADLAIGDGAEPFGTTINAGRVILLRGSAKGLTTAGGQYFTQETPGIPGDSVERDRFGERLTLSDLNNDGKADLTVCGPEDDRNMGSAWILPGTAEGLRATGTVRFGPADFGLKDKRAYGGDLIG